MSQEIFGHISSRPGFEYVTSKWDLTIIDLYEVIWDDLKGKDVSILEFGVYFGESMRYWKEFFGPGSKIIGADHCPVENRQSPQAIENMKDFTIESCEQASIASLSALAEKYGNWDILVDDANHSAPETENTFRVFWPRIKEGGWYVVEDCGDPAMESLVYKLMQEVIDSRQGKGVYFREFKGFGKIGSSSPTAFFKKSGSFTGLIR